MRVSAFLLLMTFLGCSMTQQMTAPPKELAAYRAFRDAAHPGRRLARAQMYLIKFPKGRWSEEVRAAFDGEEASYFERAQATREGAIDYIVDLPEGPNIEAARASLRAFSAASQDLDVLQLLTDVRRTEKQLDKLTAQRERVTERITAAVGLFLDKKVYGAHVDDVSPALKRLLFGVPVPMGSKRATIREDVPFKLPTSQGLRDRVAHVDVWATLDRGRIVEGHVEGIDLFVVWAEADKVRVLDVGRASDRAFARAHAREILAGALEATLPAGRCDQASEKFVIVRRCDGWEVLATMGQGPSEVDSMTIRYDAPK